MPRRIAYHNPAPQAAQARPLYERGQDRREAKAFYKSASWRRVRAAHLAAHPLCEDCLKAGRVTAALHVHHVLERRDRPDLALDPANLESACPPCHNAKRRSDG